MMAQRQIFPAHAIPNPRGRLGKDAPLAPLCWFRTGGKADWLFEPADESDLAEFLAHLARDVPVVAIGLGSNMLIRDGGIAGVVIHLGKAFASIRIEDNRLAAGGGASMVSVSHAARKAGLAGLEFLRGIPGTIGGGVRMNAGAYGREMSDCLVSARIMDRHGNIREYAGAALGFGYRHSALVSDDMVLSAVFTGTPDQPDAIGRRMDEIAAAREASQPLRTRTGGSTFRNPVGMKAWELIDAAGCRGLRIGDAQVSERHTNFLINVGHARSRDIEDLGEEVRRRVFETSGVLLEWEIARIGRKETLA